MVRCSIGFVVVAVVVLPVFNRTPVVSAKDAGVPNSSTQRAAEKIGTATATGAAATTPEQVKLGSPDLTGGIPGRGPVTNAEIKKWLDNPRNHVPLSPILPYGLVAGAGQIVNLESNPLTRAKIELGRQLYFDTRLSKEAKISCASCHDPEQGYAKDTQFGIGFGGQLGNRNSPVAYNRIFSKKQFWDGRAESLEEQAKGPIANPIEMSNTHDVCVHTIGDIPGYRLQFEKIFPDGVTIDNVAKAIASFERVLVTGPSTWDYYLPLRDFKKTIRADQVNEAQLKADEPELYDEYLKLKAASDTHPISESARRGGEIFFGEKGSCSACHVGVNFSDELYHNLGVGMDSAKPDLGRFEISKDEKDKGAFKTPTVRNIASTGPYMHDGSQKTLEEVVEWYDKGGHPNPNLDQKIKPLKLTPTEKADLVAFLKALHGDLPKVERGRLPQ